MKHGIYYAYWESEWAADYKYYVEKVARLGFDILEIGVGPIADYSQTGRTVAGGSERTCIPSISCGGEKSEMESGCIGKFSRNPDGA